MMVDESEHTQKKVSGTNYQRSKLKTLEQNMNSYDDDPKNWNNSNSKTHPEHHLGGALRQE